MEQAAKQVEKQLNCLETATTYSGIADDSNASSISVPSLTHAPATASTCPASQPPFAITSR